jgi:putative DNA primase/helicase
VIHEGPPIAGAFGCWKRSVNEKWCQSGDVSSEAANRLVHRRWGEAELARKEAEATGHEKARKTAKWILERSNPASSHAYLLAKHVNPVGKVRKYRDALVLELRDIDGELHNLQFISREGSKRFLTGGRVAGCCFTLFESPDLPLVICEGYATGASIQLASGLAVVAAITAGNLVAVAKAYRKKWPDREIVIAGDNDAFTARNQGVTKATEAANSIGGKLAVPHFADSSARPTDFNDLATLQGLDEVNRQIRAAEIQIETDEEILRRLAAMPPLDYERERDSAAQRMGCRKNVLDSLVEQRRINETQKEPTLQGLPLDFGNPEPWPDPVDGPSVLSELAGTFSRYIVLPDGAATALALWTVHAHCFDAFDCSPRLNIYSPEKGCGKTTLRDVMAQVVPRQLATENLTVAVLFRVIEAHKPTLLADECDAWLKDNEAIRSMLNAGHRRGGKALRCDGEKNEVRSFNVFCPTVLCGIGALPGTIHDRSIKIRLERAKRNELTQRFDSRRTQNEQVLIRKLVRFCADHRTQLEECDPILPPGAFNRVADNWRPLFAIAEIVGGDWPVLALAAFAQLESKDHADDQSIKTMLLIDIRQIFEETGVERIYSRVLIGKLTSMTDRPWPEINKGKPISETWLARQLRSFGISPKDIRINPDHAKGYERASFDQTFARYLPDSEDSTRDNATTQQNSALKGNTIRDPEIDCHVSDLHDEPENIGLSRCRALDPTEPIQGLLVGEI